MLLGGCNNGSPGKDSKPSNTEVSKVNSDEHGQASEQDHSADSLRRIEMPTRKGLRLQYRSNIVTFNVLGVTTLAPLTPKEVWEYHLGESSRAVVIVDELTTGVAIVLVYEAFDDGRKQFALDGKGDEKQANGWLLRGSLGEPISEKQVQKFLAKGEDSPKAFRLKGQVWVTLRDGFAHEVSLADISTEAPVPPDDSDIRSRVDFWKHRLSELTKKSAAKPGDELLKWGVQQAEDSIRHLERLRLGAEPQLPAGLTNGRITAEWVRSKPMFRIVLP